MSNNEAFQICVKDRKSMRHMPLIEVEQYSERISPKYWHIHDQGMSLLHNETKLIFGRRVRGMIIAAVAMAWDQLDRHGDCESASLMLHVAQAHVSMPTYYHQALDRLSACCEASRDPALRLIRDHIECRGLPLLLRMMSIFDDTIECVHRPVMRVDIRRAGVRKRSACILPDGEEPFSLHTMTFGHLVLACLAGVMKHQQVPRALDDVEPIWSFAEDQR